ncbi:MAG: class I SAM-dependent methyltransferase [Lachnospiraceae bacterium]|jgi:precorrin-6B methylase 2
MNKMIGKVCLNYDDYSGNDFYSEGDIENVLLDIAENEHDRPLSEILSDHRSWSVLYHFSPQRENSVSWIPMKGDEKVLEIGAGCGAITGILSEKAGSVTCVELSERRSMINALRHREKENIEIRIGNFLDVEKRLDNDFDVITLIGVLEYAGSYMNTDDPYTDLLKTVGKHLKKGGRLVIAIENRLGMKYLAGCAEDHTGVYFEGIEGYPVNKGVRTFDKPELEKLIRGSGYEGMEFYYPYPDYKLPTAVFSDDRLPLKGELRDNINNFDHERLVLFNEARAFDSLVEGGLFPIFSNSFIVIAQEENK